MSFIYFVHLYLCVYLNRKCLDIQKTITSDSVADHFFCYVINISSIWGITGASCEVHYSVSKAGVDALTKALAKELGPSSIRVNSIAPGIINTEMNAHLSEEEKQNIEEEIPLEKIGKAIDIERCVEWLIKDEYTTGQVISINGGWNIENKKI